MHKCDITLYTCQELFLWEHRSEYARPTHTGSCQKFQCQSYGAVVQRDLRNRYRMDNTSSHCNNEQKETRTPCAEPCYTR